MPTSLTLEYYEMMHDTMLQMETAKSEFNVDPKAIDRHLAGLANNLQTWANGVVAGFYGITKGTTATAEQVLAQAMMGLSDAERHQFLLTNFLEGLKRGESPARLVNRYNDIGLANIEVPARPVAQTSTVEATVTQVKPAGIILKMMNGLASICAPLIKMALIVAKPIFERLKIKFQLIIGTMAGLPSLHFLLEGELKISESFEFLGALFRRTASAFG